MDMAGDQTSTCHIMDEQNDAKVNATHGSMRRRRILFTIFIYINYIFHGVNNNLLGPSLIDLEDLTSSSTKSITIVFTCRYGGYFLGTILCGPIIDRVSEKFLIGVALCCSAAATAITPLWRNLPGLFITCGFGGIAISLNTVCLAATLLAIWKDDAKPYLQALQLFVTLGSAISPQIMKPFLRKHTSINEVTGLQENKTNDLVQDRVQFNSTSVEVKTNIQYCYFIVASCLFILSFISFVIFISGGCEFWKKKQSKKDSQRTRALIEGKGKVVVLIMFFLQSVTFGGIEETSGGLLMTFVVKHLQLSKDVGSDMATLFWGAITISCCIGIIICKYVRATRILTAQLLILLAVSLTLVLAVNKHWIVPWICFAVGGLCTGNMFATLINWANSCVHMKGKETAVFFAGTSFSGITIPPLVGFLFQVKNPMWFTYMFLILAVVFQLLFWVNLLFVQCLLSKAKVQLDETLEEQEKVM